jgi:putative FmdB family regulatory protein
MPTYVYECEKCGHTFERFQGMKETPVKTCPDCRGKVRRLVSAGAGIISKGSGSHVTDYGRSRGNAPPCGSSKTCCGRDTRCDSPSCES